MIKPTSVSLTEATYHRTRAYILSAQAKPDDKLKVADLAAMMEASPSVVREALSRLVSEGLVVAEPQRGFRVAPLELSDVRYLFDARIQIECACLSGAIRNADLTWESKLVAALHELTRTPEERGVQGDSVSTHWAAAHANFHQALVSTCPNPWYLKIRANLYLHSERFLALAMVSRPADRDLRAEHTEIAEAAIARDESAAQALMTLHLNRTVKEFCLSE
ncbi:GntR family transcriptional regulator [Sphingobium sp. TomTYG45]